MAAFLVSNGKSSSVLGFNKPASELGILHACACIAGMGAKAGRWHHQEYSCMVVKRQQCCMVVHIPPWLMVSRGSHCMANKFDTMQILQRGEKEEPAKWCCFLRLILLFFSTLSMRYTAYVK